MSEFGIIFNGHDLSKYFRVTYLERGIGNTRNNKLHKNENKDFAEYEGYTLDEKTIPMGFRMRYDLIEKSRELADILNVSEPARLIFSDDPDVYYLAVPDGELSTDELSFRKNCDMAWLVPDGVAHAVEPKEFSNVNAEPVTIVSDFKDKTAGSLVECPHELKYGPTDATSLLTPEDIRWWSATQVHYDNVMYLDNTLTSANHNADGLIAQMFITFNILETVKRAYPSLFEGLGESEQVEKLKKSITKLSPQAWAMGSGPKGNKVSFSVWNVWTWSASTPNTTNGIKKLAHIWNTSGAINAYINDKGILNMLLYADPSDGTTPSSVSLDYTNVEITLKLPNGKIVTIVNEGTYPTYPVIEAKMKGDNGLLAFITDSGSLLQFGNPHEVDGFNYDISDNVIYESMVNQGGWSVNQGEIIYKELANSNGVKNKIGGRWDWDKTPQSVFPIFSETLPNSWYGPSLHRAIPKNSNDKNDGNFEYRARFNFPTNIQQVGRVEFNLQNGTDIPFGIIVRDSLHSAKQIVFEIHIGLQRIWYMNLNLKDFPGNFFEVKIRRSDGKIHFEFNSIRSIANGVVTPAKSVYKSFDLPEYLDIPVTHITQWVSVFGKKERANISLADTRFTWINVEKWRDSPNLYTKDDEVVIDTESAETQVNGVKRNIHASANMWSGFELPPGKTTIHCTVSDWAETPDVNFKIREAHL